MARELLKDCPYERFSPSPVLGLAPGVTVTLHLPVSGRKIVGKRALIDTGAEMTQVYPRDVDIDLISDVDYDPDRRVMLAGVEIAGHVYRNVECVYEDHQYAGTEHMLVGMNLLLNWLVTLHGKDRLLSVAHL